MTLISFLTLSLVLRLSGLASSNLWFDEWVSLHRVIQPLAEYIHDPTDYIGVNLWELILRLFAFEPHWVLRLPALMCAMLSLWIAWKIMQALSFSNTQSTIAALTMACLPGLLWMSQDARYYAPLTALYMASVWSAIRGRSIWLTVCIILSFCIHPTGPAYTVPAVGIALIMQTISWRNAYIIGGYSGALWIVCVMLSPMVGASFWTEHLTLSRFIYEYGQSLTINTLGHPGILIAFVCGCLLFITGLIRIFILRSSDELVTWIIWSGPLAILLLVSLTYQNVITYRTLQPAAMGLALMAGRILAADLRWRWTWIPAGALLIALLLNWDSSARGGDLSAIADHIRDAWRTGDVLVYSSDGAMPLDLLLDDLPHCQLDKNECTLDQFADRRVWLIWSPALVRDAALNDKLKNITAHLVSVDRTANAWQIVPTNIYLLDIR